MPSSIITIIGSKGGVGATTLSFELAQALARRRRIALVDGDFAGRRTVALLMNCVKELDEARDESNNLSFVTLRDGLTAVELANNIHAGFTLKPEKVEALVENFAQTGTSAIVDAPQPFAAAIRPFIVRCVRFFVVLEPTLLGLAGAKAMMVELQKFGISLSQIAAVSIQRDSQAEFPKSDIERALGTKLMAEIPPKSDRRYARAVEAFVEYAGGLLTVPEQMLDLGPSIRSPLGDRRLAKLRAPTQLQGGMEGRKASGIDLEKIEKIKSSTHEALTKRLDLASSRDRSDPLKAEELQREVQAVVNELITEEAVGSAEEVAQLRQEVIDEALGYGPLEDLLRDPDVTEIMANGPENIYVERGGKLQLSSKHFTNERQLRLVIERMIAPLGRRIDESTPMVDGRLSDGSRINAIIEPLAISGATLTIRRFGSERLQVSNLLEKRSLVPGMVDFLRACVEGRLNVVVSGGTGSGKTTLLNILSSFIPESDRIITIEDAAELKLEQDHVVRLEARPPNLEGRGEIRIRDLVRNSLRMRPDRIIVGECRGGEALDMLQAMNTGHDGSLTTIHANTPRDCLSRIETMVMMAGFDLPSRAIREQVANAIDLVVQVARLRDGSRKIIAITEVVGMEGETITTQDIVTYQQRGLDKEGHVVGDFLYSGVQPNCAERFGEYGITYDIRGLSEMTAAIKW